VKSDALRYLLLYWFLRIAIRWIERIVIAIGAAAKRNRSIAVGAGKARIKS